MKRSMLAQTPGLGRPAGTVIAGGRTIIGGKRTGRGFSSLPHGTDIRASGADALGYGRPIAPDRSPMGRCPQPPMKAASSSGVPSGNAAFRWSRKADTRALSSRRDG